MAASLGVSRLTHSLGQSSFNPLACQPGRLDATPAAFLPSWQLAQAVVTCTHRHGLSIDALTEPRGSMMDAIDRLFGGFETHAPDEIRAAVRDGADPVTPIRGKAPIYWLVEMYTRSPRFGACLRVMMDMGAELNDSLLEAILMDDAVRLGETLSESPSELERSLSLACAYTSLRGVSALHVCSEFNCTNAARVLLDAGMHVDTRATTDENGLGGQTPLFHAVNSNRKYCRPMMELLVEAGANIDVRLKGLIWGGGFDWETVVFDVTPISYAQCGLFPQFHRREQDVYANIEFLMRRGYGGAIQIANVPNKYVDEGFDLAAARAGQAAEHPDPPSENP